MAAKYHKATHEMVAHVLKYALPGDEFPERIRVAKAFAGLFAGDNPLFDEQRFYEACEMWG